MKKEVNKKMCEKPGDVAANGKPKQPKREQSQTESSSPRARQLKN